METDGKAPAGDAFSPARCEMSFPGSAGPSLAPRGSHGSFPGPDPARWHGPSANYRVLWKRRRFDLISPERGEGGAAQTAAGHPRSWVLCSAGRVEPALPHHLRPPGADANPCGFPPCGKRGFLPAGDAGSSFPGWAQGAAPHHPLGNETPRTGKSCPGLVESFSWDKTPRARKAWRRESHCVHATCMFMYVYICTCVCMR